MGTPHRDSPAAPWGTLIANIMYLMDLRRDLISALKPDSKVFETIADSFRYRADNLKVFSYYEGKKVEKFGLLSSLIVPKNSATLGWPGEVRRPIERDHTSMCRFPDADDGYYRSIVEDLKRCVSPQSEKVTSSPKVEEILAWLGRKAGSVRSPAAPQPLAGTCRWFFQQDRFSDWLSSGTRQGLLWVTGDSGSGKTLLSKFVADNLGEYVRSQLSPPIFGLVTVCYFSCDQVFSSETGGVKMLSTLLYQILIEHEELSGHAIRQWGKKDQPLLENFDTLWKVFIATLKDIRLGYTIIIIIDAIDECKEATQQLYVEEFRSLLRTECVGPKMRILFTSQRSMVLKSSFYDVPNIHLDDAPFSGYVSEDVNMFIKHELDKGPQCQPSHREFLERSLCEQADRTYLWVKFVIQELHKMRGGFEKTIQEKLDSIPKDLTKLYKQCLVVLRHDEDSDSWQDAVKLLKIISASFQPLDRNDISFAVAVSGYHSRIADVDKDRDFNIEPHIRKTLGFLVRIADCRVYLIHTSLKRYLEGLSSQAKDNDLAPFALTTEAAHLEMSRICTNYLSLQDFNDDHFQRAPYSVENSCQFLDFDPEYSGIDFMLNSEDLESSEKGFKFFDYCAINWTTHVALASQSAAEDAGILAAVVKICTEKSSVLRNWLNYHWSTLGSRKERHYGFDPMVVASYFGLDAVTLSLIDKGLVDVAKSGPRALYWAANEGRTSNVKILLSHDVPTSFKSILDWTPLMRAASAGHTETVKALLSVNEIEVNETTSCGRTALSYAIGNGHIEISRLLMSTPNINVNNIDSEESTPLIYAVSDGNEDALRLLLADGRAHLAHVNRHDRTALSFAAEYGHIEVMKLLLAQPSHSTNLKLENHRKCSPLLYAVEKGHLEIVKLLRDSGRINFSATNKEGFNTVILASKYHHVNVLQYLSVQDPEGFKGIDLSLPTPLGFAFIENGPRRLKAIEYLLETNLVDLEQRDSKSGRTTLFRASASGFVEGVQRLIDKGAKLDVVDERGWTPLHYVIALSRNPEMVDCLLSNGANLNIRDNDKLTPMELAKKHSKEDANPQLSEIIQILGEKMTEIAVLKAERKKAQKSGLNSRNM